MGSIYLETNPYWSSSALSGSVWGVHFADITGDGYPEVFVVGEQIPCYMFSNDSGVISHTPTWQSNDADVSIWASFGDYDNDGDLDMAVANYYVSGGRTKVYRNDNGTLTNDPVWTASSDGGVWCEWGDVDNDGDLDLAISDIFDNPAVFRNNGGILEPTPFWIGFDYNIDFGGAWIDVDMDGDLDLVISGINPGEPVHRLYYNNNGNLETYASWTSQLDPSYVGAINAAGDINKDGWPDLAAPMGLTTSNNENAVYRNLSGVLEQIPSWFSSDNRYSTSCALGDINGDGYLDWAVNNHEDVSVVYENISGTLNTTPAWQSSTYGGIGIDLGDVDQDGVVYKEDTIIAEGTKKLFYLSVLPIHKFIGVSIDGDSVPVMGYCYNPRAGWVSFKDSITAGSEIIFKYYYSTDLELLQSDYNSGQAHLFRNNVGIAEYISKPMDIGFKAYPSPFSDKLHILFSASDDAKKEVVRIRIYDPIGRLVKTLNLFQGNHSTTQPFNQVVWDGTDDSGHRLPGGIYFLRLEAGDYNKTEKVILVR